MKITHYNNIDFQIEADGSISRSNTWHVMPDDNVLDSWETFGDSVKTWAGNRGDAFRMPKNSSTGYTSDSNYIISDIKFKSISRFMYEVTFTGKPKYATAEMIGGVSTSTNHNDETTKTAKWRVHADNMESFLPAIGDVISWSGNAYLCDNVKSDLIRAGIYEVVIVARDMAVLMVGNPIYRKTAMMEQVKTAKWRVSNDEYDSWIADRDVGISAESWAGSGYYITGVSADPIGKLGYYVTIEAKHIGVRLIESRRSEKFLRKDAAGGVVREVSYTGRWQVHADNLAEFQDLTGKSADDWTGDTNTTVINIDPVKVSESEYEVTLKALDLTQSTRVSISKNTTGSFTGKTKTYTSIGDFKPTAKDCGWYLGNDGIWDKINNKSEGSWNSYEDCPFLVDAELPNAMIDVSISCVKVTIESYAKGDPAKYVDSAIDWNETKVEYATIGKHEGWWRRVNQDFTEVYDNEGDIWTKFVREYLYSPSSDLEWNIFYWHNHE